MLAVATTTVAIIIGSVVHVDAFSFERQQRVGRQRLSVNMMSDNNNDPLLLSRRNLLLKTSSAFITATAATVFTSATTPVAHAADSTPSASTDSKLTNLSNEELASKITSDIVEKQFLVTGNLSRELYDEGATFTDEIDTYTLEQWMKGTSKLFVPTKSHIDYDSLKVSNEQVTFLFTENLCFNIPLLLPTVYLSGKVILERGPNGLITSYKEQWDQDVPTVLKSAKLFS
jgi:hypothetical protein